ncbi:MAG: macrocin O-methyltransferase, partial [Chitinophagaceae bacterium]
MLKKNIQYILAKKGYKIVKTGSSNPYADMEPKFIEYFEKCKNYTRTSIERMYSVYKSVEYVVKNNLEGDMVECGTWR